MHDGLLEVTVSRTWPLASGYRAVELRATKGASLPPFDDGAMLDVVLDAHAARSRRQPLYRDASQRGNYVVGVRTPLADDGVFQPGNELLVHPPENLPLAIGERSRYVLFAGGLGVTTIAGIARRLADAGKSFELHHFAQSADRALLMDELQALREFGGIHHRVGLSVDEISRVVSHALSPNHADTQVFCSGPPRLMDIVQANARDWVYPRNVHKIYLGETVPSARSLRA